MNKFETIRTGVIGVGSMGQNHARIYNEISNLVAVADPDEIQGSKVAARFNIPWYSDYNDMLDHVDAVTIAVPTVFHRTVAETVASAGVHILIEKPLADNVEDGRAILKKVEATGIICSVGHIERHNPVISVAKEALSKNEWGDLITLYSRRVSNFPDRIHDVGVLFDLLIHDIDISSYLVANKLSTVYATGGQMKAKYEDYANVVMKHENGIISVCEANWLTPMKIRKLSLTTSTNYIELDYQNQTIHLFKSDYVEVNPENLYSSNLDFSSQFLEVEKKEPLLLELLDFLKAINNNTQPLVTALDGLRVVEISEASLKSLETSQSQKLNLEV